MARTIQGTRGLNPPRTQQTWDSQKQSPPTRQTGSSQPQHAGQLACGSRRLACTPPRQRVPSLLQTGRGPHTVHGVECRPASGHRRNRDSILDGVGAQQQVFPYGRRTSQSNRASEFRRWHTKSSQPTIAAAVPTISRPFLHSPSKAEPKPGNSVGSRKSNCPVR